MRVLLIIVALMIVSASSLIVEMAKAAIKLRRMAELPIQLFKPITYKWKQPRTNTFDYIIVGSGPSGCVIANRLTKDSSTTVLLIEAGKDDNVITDVPLINPFLALTDWSWNYDTVPTNDTCLGMTHERCPWPSGKGPGGGTIVNAMIWTRGNPADFDRWAQLGNAGWSYEELLPYFMKSERTNIPELDGSRYHGRRGPLNIEYPSFRTRISRDYINAGKALGYQEVDYNDPRSHIGFSYIQATVNDGERVTAATAYLKPILDRPNLSILLDSRVIKVLINPATRNAYGVRYIRKGKEYDVFARKEVILSAGAFGSPQLLLLSGIGPAKHLMDVGISPLIDLPVGDNLMEHQGMHGLTFTVKTNDTIYVPELIENILPVSATYLGKGHGMLTSLGCEVIAFLRTRYANITMPAEKVPDVELLFVSAGMQADEGILFRKAFGISDELYEYTYKPYEGQRSFSIWPLLMSPRSRGKVRLKDNNPLSKPIIEHGFFTDPEQIDIKTLVEAIKIAIMLSETPPLQKHGAKLVKQPFPNCRSIPFGTDRYWECAIRTVSTQFHHQSGTCAMGKVVNDRLQVYGLRGLRVADASVMPTIPGGHIQSAAYMIGEKAADLIMEDNYLNNIIR